MNITRDFYIPTGAIKLETIPGVDVYQYINQINNCPAAMCFTGRSQKPTWRYYFKNVEHLQDYVNKTINNYRLRQKAKLDAAAERKARKEQASKTVAIGDIFVESSHYESTIIKFWQVVAKRGTKLELKSINKTLVHTDESGRNEDYMPDINNFNDGEILKCSIRDQHSDTVYLKCESWYSITSWTGRPVYQTIVNL